jgi:hypothetical protein
VTSYAVVAAVLLGAALLARRLPDSTLAWWDARPRAVHSRWLPGAIALMTAAITAWVWGHAIAPTAVVHDEASYLFQARIFAHGAFAMPAPPLPEFFEQFHVYVTPAFASKYPPGHALLLAPGLLLGWPALMPLLLAAVTGALVFLLARRASNGWVAFMTWLIWITAKDTLHPLASWFSQSSSGALWLLGWWALWSWRDTGRRSWLVALAACIGWLAITRPLTAVAYAATAGAVVLARTARRRSWPDLVPALVLGVAILALIPYANWRTTGRWRVMPYSEYSKIYFPFDAPGFGVDSSAPRRALPPDMVRFAVATRLVHVGYEPAALPRALVSRLAHVATGMWSGPRVVLGAVALLAIPSIGAEVGLALASVLVLALCYLSFAHPAGWTLYYTEILPVLALLSGMGLWRLLGADPRPTAESPSRRASAAAVVAAALMLLSAPEAVRRWSNWRMESRATQAYQREIGALFASIPDARSIVFVRYAPTHNLHTSLIVNDPDLAHARRWIVYDRGADNVRLMRVAPERTPYLFDEATYSIARYQSPPGP